MKKVVSIITAFLLGVLGLTTLSVQTAEAHNSSVSADCTKLSVNLTNYATQTGKNNTVKVVINGDVKVDSTFGASYSNSWNFSQTQINTWSVKVVAWDNSSYNVDKSGTQKPCSKPDKPDTKVTDTQQGDCTTAYSSRTRTGTQAYKFDESSWSWVKDGDPNWNKWIETAWTDEAWFKSCAPDKPKDIVTPYSDKKQGCTGVYETSWNMTQTYSWDAKSRKWILGDPVKTDFVDWHKTGDVSNEYFDANCKPDQPAPEPRTKYEESCTLNDVGGRNDYTGTEAYVWNSDTRKWELSGVVVWNDPVFTPYTDNQYQKACAPSQPEPKKHVEKQEACNLVDYGFDGEAGYVDRDGTEDYVWNTETRTWELSGDIKWGDWKLTPYNDKEYFSKCAPAQPNPEPRVKVEESCTVGGYTHYTGTEAYVWDDESRTWVLSGDIIWDEETTFVPYTDEEYLAKGCTEYPGDKVVPKSDHKENCDGLWDRNWDVVTTYTLKNHEWVANNPKIQNDTGWVLDRKLTKAEKANKGCVIPDEVLAYTGVSDEGIMVYGVAGLGAILIGLMTVGFLHRRRTN